MQWKSLAFALVVGVAFTVGSVTNAGSAYAACDPGVVIDKSTAADARKKIEAAGYRKVSNLRKGCDNYWHGSAEKDGKPVFVVLSPQGEVMEEGN